MKALAACGTISSSSAVEFTLNGSLGELDRLTERVGLFCRERSLAPEVDYDLNLVLEELFVNAVRHGGCEGMAEAVHVSLQVNGEDVLMEFADRGTPFDPTAVPAPRLEGPLEDRRGGGLGIHLVRGLTRDFEYRRETGRNVLTMRRPVPAEKSEG